MCCHSSEVKLFRHLWNRWMLMALTCLQCRRWSRLVRAAWKIKTCSLFYSCDPPQKHIFGTDFLVNKQIKHLALDFKAKSFRLCSLRIRGLFFNYSIICAHVPTKEKDEQKKDSSYCDPRVQIFECENEVRGKFWLMWGIFHQKFKNWK